MSRIPQIDPFVTDDPTAAAQDSVQGISANLNAAADRQNRAAISGAQLRAQAEAQKAQIEAQAKAQEAELEQRNAALESRQESFEKLNAARLQQQREGQQFQSQRDEQQFMRQKELKEMDERLIQKRREAEVQMAEEREARALARAAGRRDAVSDHTENIIRIQNHIQKEEAAAAGITEHMANLEAGREDVVAEMQAGFQLLSQQAAQLRETFSLDAADAITSGLARFGERSLAEIVGDITATAATEGLDEALSEEGVPIDTLRRIAENGVGGVAVEVGRGIGRAVVGAGESVGRFLLGATPEEAGEPPEVVVGRAADRFIGDMSSRMQDIGMFKRAGFEDPAVARGKFESLTRALMRRGSLTLDENATDAEKAAVDEEIAARGAELAAEPGAAEGAVSVMLDRVFAAADMTDRVREQMIEQGILTTNGEFKDTKEGRLMQQTLSYLGRGRDHIEKAGFQDPAFAAENAKKALNMTLVPLNRIEPELYRQKATKLVAAMRRKGLPEDQIRAAIDLEAGEQALQDLVEARAEGEATRQKIQDLSSEIALEQVALSRDAAEFDRQEAESLLENSNE